MRERVKRKVHDKMCNAAGPNGRKHDHRLYEIRSERSIRAKIKRSGRFNQGVDVRVEVLGALINTSFSMSVPTEPRELPVNHVIYMLN